MNRETWVLRLAPGHSGVRTVHDLAVELNLSAPEDGLFDPPVWSDGGTSMRLAGETVVGRDGSTLTVEFVWEAGELPPAEWGWGTFPAWLTVVERPVERERAA